MNDIVQTTLIGLLGTGLLGIAVHYLRDLSARFSNLEAAVQTMDTKFTGAIKDLEIRLSNKFTVEINALDTKFTDQLKGHGERLARIEAKLDIDPPAEAA